MKEIYSEKVRFYPWEGTKYAHQDLKILVLGESVYLKTQGEKGESKPKDWVQQIIRDRMALNTASSSLQTFLKNNRMILNSKESKKAAALWGKLAFYNFIQGIAGNAADSKIKHHTKKWITPEIVKKSQEALPEVLNALNPDLVIVWGVWENSKIHGWLPENKIMVNKELKLWRLEGHPALFWNIPHPSSWKYFKWAEQHLKYLKVCQQLGKKFPS